MTDWLTELTYICSFYSHAIMIPQPTSTGMLWRDKILDYVGWDDSIYINESVQINMIQS